MSNIEGQLAHFATDGQVQKLGGELRADIAALAGSMKLFVAVVGVVVTVGSTLK